MRSAALGMTTRRIPRLLLAGALLVVAALTLLAALDLTTLTYLLPPVPGSTVPNRHTTLWAPGVAVAVVAGVVVVASAAWLVWNLARVPPRSCWWVAGGLVAIAVAATAGVGSLPTPTF